MSKRYLSLLLVVVMILSTATSLISAQSDEQITLTVLTHWGEEGPLASQLATYDEYMALHPNITIELQTVPFNDLYTKIVTGRTAGTSPDIYHIYNLWLPEFVNSGMLSVPAEDVVQDVTENAASTSVSGVTVADQVWGYPTEVNTYLLLYNKRLLEDAGYSEPPATWDELKEMAPAITKVDDTGAISQIGFGVITGWDSGVVHPFMSLLMSNGGSYFNEDYTELALGSQQGLETLQLYSDLLASGGMDLSVGWDNFPNGNIGMLIMANWWRATLMASENIDYVNDVGVAPIPVGPSGETTATLAYNWLFAVDAGSAHEQAAWDLVKWLNTPRGEGEASPAGDFLVNDLGAIPSMLADQEVFADDLGDHFLAPFVASTSYAMQEPVIGGSQEIKTMLQSEIEALWTGMTDPQSVVDFIVPEANAILEEFRMASED